MRRALVLVLLACDASPSVQSNTWRAASDAPEPRAHGAAVSDGARLYAIGGLDARGEPSPRVHVLMVGTNRWYRAPDLPPGAGTHHLVALREAGKIWLFGGLDGNALVPVAARGAFVLEGERWRALPDLPRARGASTAQAIEGKIYLAAGTNAVTLVPELDIFDVATNTWTTGAPLTTPRSGAASCVVEGKLVVIGGFLAGGAPSSTVEAYDPRANTWERWPDLPTARGDLATASFQDRCYAIGGRATEPLGANELFDPASRRWAVLAPMPTPRAGLGLVSSPPEILAVSGERASGVTAMMEAYTP